MDCKDRRRKPARQRNVWPAPVILSALLLGLAACQDAEARLVDGTMYESHLPPRTGEIGEALRIDEVNTITVTAVTERHDEDGPCVIITYDWHNGGTSGGTLAEAVILTVSQSGLELDADVALLNPDEKQKLVTMNPAGGTIEGISQGYRPDNREPLTLAIEGSMLNVFVDGIPQAAWQVTIELPYPG